MSKASCGEDWIKICTLLGIGVPLRPPQPVTGGFLHHMWRIDTKSGIFAVKILNPEIMSRPDAKRNYRLSERITQVAYSNGIHAVPAKKIGNEPWVEVEGRYIMVFDWVYGYTLRPEQCTFEHGKRIGEVLFQVHNLNIEFDGLELPSFPTVPDETWRGHIEEAQREIKCWGFSCDTLLQDIYNWSRLYQNAMNNLSQQVVISHRDLDSKNVIWNKEKPFLIDWESAGYVNPVVELIEVALNWSRNSDGTSNKKRFQAVIEAYLNNGGTLRGRVLDALYGSFGGMLGWLEYNMRRSLDKGVFTVDDRELGHKEVLHTIRDLKKLNEAVSDYSQWIKEVS